MHIFIRFVNSLKKIIWTLLVAYMIGLHNVFKQETKTPDDIVITIVAEEVQGDNAPND